ncbi:serine/threonine protein phosphatase [Streptomyces griseus]|uniref:protein phosphatase 2C domain-containing protein n=1 Tax=Streptomyces globisporus TaxID=1908 RepID=UPI0005C9E546|nr:protein phosphatase 2C domain-containing protein [Streptomyces globisporus]AWL90571.1 serine/threonine-protein phosphatase [Streptomyces globisporus]PPA44512.1 serine/threonine protein phosphatase [Streptomyces griseus]RAN21734.1 serine/threonine protein phosphatase [Streptomyces badius]RAN29667.1 serine/threonine protein phosphatase [Streptomyces badius]
MSQNHQQPALSKCPGCDEPPAAGDLFCGACGYDLSSVPARPGDRPTMAITVPPAAPEAPAAPVASAGQAAPAASGAEAVRWPAATETDSSDVPAPVHRPSDLPGTDSGGRPLAEQEQVQGQGAAAGQGAPVGPGPEPVGGPEPSAVPVRHDDRAEPGGAEHSGDFALAAPDPRTAEHAAAAAAPTAGGKVCVACRSGRVDPDGYCENCGHAQPRERDHMEQELGSVAAVSDRGLRHHRNEDSFAVSSTALPDGSPAVVAIVCDGVSSASRPDEASAAAANAANESLLASLPRGTHPQQAMHEAIVAASEAVNALAQEPAGAMEHDAHRHQNAPACTLVGAVMAGELLIVGWVGDSRVYWVPEDRSRPTARLTEDDSWAAQMVAAGLMNEAEAYADERAHAITGWLGADAYELEPHTAAFKPDRPGLVVVCTDGLWNYAESAEEMAAAVPADAQEHPLRGAQVLVGHALDGGGHDNVTVALLPFAVRPQGAGSACETV